MKILNSLFILSALLVFFSCGDDEAEENEADIVGSWQSTDLILRDCEDENNNVAKSIECPGENCIRYTFSIDSTRAFIKETVQATGSEFETGTFSVGETRIEFCTDDEGEVDCQSLKFTVNKSVLVLLSEDQDTQCTREIKLLREEEPESN